MKLHANETCVVHIELTLKKSPSAVLGSNASLMSDNGRFVADGIIPDCTSSGSRTSTRKMSYK